MPPHILSARQFRAEDVDRLCDLADSTRKGWLRSLQNRVVATLFYEPSTRTRLSFEAAAMRLGAGVISTENAAQFSSAVKGESVEDTVRVVSSYCDAIVIRHSEPGAVSRAADKARVPVINAGDGNGEHPTQALLDLYTVRRELGEVNGLHYCLVGDLKNGRTIHSLIYLLGLYKDVRITLVSTDDLTLSGDVVHFMNERGMSWRRMDSLPRALDEGPDVVYSTRLQTERMSVVRVHGYDSFQLTPDLVSRMKRRSVVMHPLPRQAELPKEVDGDHRAAYFRQAENGLWMRAALLRDLLA